MKKGVIKTATGELLRSGYCDFENDGSFDSATETYREDVPDDATVRREAGSYSSWDGSAWVTKQESLVSHKKRKKRAIDAKTVSLIVKGFTFDGDVFSTSIRAQINWNNLKHSESDFTWPVEISTRNGGAYSLTQANLPSFWLASRDHIKGHYDSGRALRVQVNAATTHAEVDAVVDTR